MEGNAKDDGEPTTALPERQDTERDPREGEEEPLLIHVVSDDIEGHTSNSQTPPRWTRDAEFDGLPWWHRPSTYWLLPGFFLYCLAFGGIVVPRLNLILTLVCRKYIAEQAILHPEFSFVPVVMFGENPQCRVPEVQALATKFNLYISLIAGLLSAASSPRMGALSDRYGRKYLLCISVFGGLLSELVTILAASYPNTIHYTWLLLGSFFEGIFGSFITGMALTHSYAADCTEPSKRGVAFGYFYACLCGGIALGPFIAAYVAKGSGNLADKGSGNLLDVFWLALACHAVFMLYVLFLVPESLSKKKQLAARERDRVENASSDERSLFHALKVANFLAPLKVLWPTGPGSSPQLRANLVLLSTVNTIIFGVALGSGAVVIFYTNYAFDWGDFETQIFVGTANASRVVALIIFLPFLNYLFRTRYQNKLRRESGVILEIRNSGTDNLDLYTILAALAFEIISYAGYAAARTGPLFFASGLVAAFGGTALPILQSALTKHVPHDRVGQLLGALGLLNALGRVVCPTIFSLLYASTVATFPQAVFVVLCAIFGVAFVVCWFVKPHVYLEDDGAPPATPEAEYTDLVADELVDEEIVQV